MKKVLCINKVYPHCRITIGKYYYVVSEYWTSSGKMTVLAYVIESDDTGTRANYTSDQFKDVYEIRNEKLEAIGI